MKITPLPYKITLPKCYKTTYDIQAFLEKFKAMSYVLMLISICTRKINIPKYIHTFVILKKNIFRHTEPDKKDWTIPSV